MVETPGSQSFCQQKDQELLASSTRIMDGSLPRLILKYPLVGFVFPRFPLRPARHRLLRIFSTIHQMVEAPGRFSVLHLWFSTRYSSLMMRQDGQPQLITHLNPCFTSLLTEEGTGRCKTCQFLPGKS